MGTEGSRGAVGSGRSRSGGVALWCPEGLLGQLLLFGTEAEEEEDETEEVEAGVEAEEGLLGTGREEPREEDVQEQVVQEDGGTGAPATSEDGVRGSSSPPAPASGSGRGPGGGLVNSFLASGSEAVPSERGIWDMLSVIPPLLTKRKKKKYG